MKLSAKDLSGIPHTEFRNSWRLKGKKITGVSTDSRTVKAGDVFFALRGDQYDGHVFLARAFEQGAMAAVVDRASAVAIQDGSPLLVVENTTQALGQLAHMYRLKFSIPVIAIGGSNGKTTTKEMVAKVLATQYDVLSTEGNLNNHIGVPHTLFRLQKKNEVAVVEIGTNHPGEIEYLCRVLEPTHGLITNIGREHLEFFTSLDGVAREEVVLFETLGKTKGSVIFVNADDARLEKKARRVKRRTTYGITSTRVDVKGSVAGFDESGCATLRVRGRKAKRAFEVRLAIPGYHNAANALAAVAVGLSFNIRQKRIRKALEAFRPAAKRMEVLNLGGVLIYNDTYNANPDSTLAALHTLATARISGKRIAVLADMRELGGDSIEHHAHVGAEAAKLKVDYLLTYGDLARHIHTASRLPMAVHYDQKSMLAEYLVELIAPGDAVLIKGSRGMKMEDIVIFLEERLRSAVVPFG